MGIRKYDGTNEKKNQKKKKGIFVKKGDICDGGLLSRALLFHLLWAQRRGPFFALFFCPKKEEMLFFFSHTRRQQGAVEKKEDCLFFLFCVFFAPIRIGLTKNQEVLLSGRLTQKNGNAFCRSGAPGEKTAQWKYSPSFRLFRFFRRRVEKCTHKKQCRHFLFLSFVHNV